MTIPLDTTFAVYAAKRYERAVQVKISKSNLPPASRVQLWRSMNFDARSGCDESSSRLGPMMPSRGGEALQPRSIGKREPSSKRRDSNNPSSGQSLQARRSTKSCTT